MWQIFGMKHLFFGILFFLFSCKEKDSKDLAFSDLMNNEVQFAKGLVIKTYPQYYKVMVKNVFENNAKTFTYIFHREKAIIPDSLKFYPHITIPVNKMVVTSTTHIPALELLNKQHHIVGFPQLDYISSEKTRSLIDAKKIIEVGNNQQLNIEILLQLQPEVLVGFGVDAESATYQKLQQNGIPVCYNAEWREQHPLGRAEWIKFFGVLTDDLPNATQKFDEIKQSYLALQQKAKQAKTTPIVMSGSDFQGIWYVPQKDSWAVKVLYDANAKYLFNQFKGSGSEKLSMEVVLLQASQASFWIGTGQYETKNQLLQSLPSFKDFEAVKQNKMFTSSSKKGPTGGILFYELASMRPDLVLEDLIRILHPDLLAPGTLHFYESLP